MEGPRVRMAHNRPQIVQSASFARLLGHRRWRERAREAAVDGKSVTLRALSILEAFDWAHRRLTLTDIARRSNLPLATAHRHIQELLDWRALERMPDGTYQIGARLWR